MDELLLVALAPVLGPEASLDILSLVCSMLLQVLGCPSTGCPCLVSVFLLVAIVEFDFPRIMFLIACSFDGHVQFLKDVLRIVGNREI